MFRVCRGRAHVEIMQQREQKMHQLWRKPQNTIYEMQNEKRCNKDEERGRKGDSIILPDNKDKQHPHNE